MKALILASFLLQSGADTHHETAQQKLEAGDAAGAEDAARMALAASQSFTPEDEIEGRPDKGLLFEDMILEARGRYRTRRARYFRTLGDALDAQEKWRESRKAYGRAAAIAPEPAIFLLMADDPDLSDAERLSLLLDAYLSPGADRADLEKSLLATGVFRDRNALKASLDARRFPGLASEFPDLELLPRAFPAFQAVTDGGTLNTGQFYRQGGLLLVYVPTDVCAHCSEQLDGITVPVMEAQRRDELMTVTAFVPEQELPIARRIVRLLAMRVGVGRIDALPPGLELLPDGELRIIARGGMTQIRLPMSPDLRSAEIRQRVEAVFSFLGAPGLPTEREPEEASIPLVTLEDRVNEHRALLEWIEQLEKLEQGPAPLDDLYERVRRLTQSVARGSGSRDVGFEIMEGLGRLRRATAAKTRAFALLGTDIGDRLLAEVQKIDANVRRTAPSGRGVFFVHVTGEMPRRVVMQRTFQTIDGFRHFNVVLEDDGGDLRLVWLAPEDDEPRGVDAVPAGAVFRYAAGEDCDGLRLVRDEAVVYESCSAVVRSDEIVEVRSAIVDAVEGGPVYYRRNVVGEREESALERGLRLYDRGDFAGAAAAFEEAEGEIDPVAPYDVADVIYNRARSLEAAGSRQEALALYRSLGDVSYQDLVDEGAGRIEGAPR